MVKSATDVMQDVINSAVVDAIVALKGSAQGLPNALLRDLNAIHANTAFEDLPEAIKKAVSSSVRDAFTRLQKQGYVIAEGKSVRPVNPGPRPAAPPGAGHRPPSRSGPDRRPPAGRGKR